MSFRSSSPPPEAFSAPGYAANQYYSGRLYQNFGSTATATANRLYFLPLEIGSLAQFTKIGIKVTSAVAGNCRLGVYKMKNGVPTSLFIDAGTVSTGSTGEKEITISTPIPAGCYAAAAVFDAAPTIVRADAAGGDNTWAAQFWGNAVNNGTGITVSAYSALAYGALPNPFVGALTYANDAMGIGPFIYFKK